MTELFVNKFKIIPGVTVPDTDAFKVFADITKVVPEFKDELDTIKLGVIV